MVELYCFYPEKKTTFLNWVNPQGYRRVYTGNGIPPMTLITDGISGRYNRPVDHRVDTLIDEFDNVYLPCYETKSHYHVTNGESYYTLSKLFDGCIIV